LPLIRLAAVIETASLKERALGEYCRRKDPTSAGPGGNHG
jgi:hypothetical protein